MSPRTQGRKSTASVPGPRTPATEQTAPAAGTVGQVEEQAPAEEGSSGMSIPLVGRSARTPNLRLPDMSSVPGRVLWLGGLGTLAALGAIDWPVAIAIAAGTWVAEQRATDRLRREEAARTTGRA